MLRRLASSLGLLLLLAAVPACLGGPQTDPPGLQGFADYQGDEDSIHRTARADGGAAGLGDAMSGFVPTPDADAGMATDPAADFAGESPAATVLPDLRPLPHQFVPPKRQAPQADGDFNAGLSH
jgi:hypothetical protein